ncbi:MAG: hypothetical protein JW873_02930 [Candidatus Saganbacteria bacterium]|nr:hypothetical protein [Candidatus Saganbacteria bacterium]
MNERGKSIIGDPNARKIVFGALRQLNPQSVSVWGSGKVRLGEYLSRHSRDDFFIEAWVEYLEGVPSKVIFRFDEGWMDVYPVELSSPAIKKKRAEIEARVARATEAALAKPIDHFVFGPDKDDAGIILPDHISMSRVSSLFDRNWQDMRLWLNGWEGKPYNEVNTALATVLTGLNNLSYDDQNYIGTGDTLHDLLRDARLGGWELKMRAAIDDRNRRVRFDISNGRDRFVFFGDL